MAQTDHKLLTPQECRQIQFFEEHRRQFTDQEREMDGAAEPQEIFGVANYVFELPQPKNTSAPFASTDPAAQPHHTRDGRRKLARDQYARFVDRPLDDFAANLRELLKHQSGTPSPELPAINPALDPDDDPETTENVTRRGRGAMRRRGKGSRRNGGRSNAAWDRPAKKMNHSPLIVTFSPGAECARRLELGHSRSTSRVVSHFRGTSLIPAIHHHHVLPTAQQEYFCSELALRPNIDTDADSRCIVCLGPAGSGKTMFAAIEAARWAQQGMRVLLTRPMDGVGDGELGALPGTLEQKLEPWLRPALEHMAGALGERELWELRESNIVELTSLIHLRGRTFENCFIIADEMQNATREELRTVISRVGCGTVLCVLGDPDQRDVSADFGSPLAKLAHNLQSDTPISCTFSVVELSDADVQLSTVAREMVGRFQHF